MKNFLKDPLKVFLSVIGLLFLACIIFLSSCGVSNERANDTFEEAQETKQAIEVVNHSEESIILETLHKGDIKSGIYKLTIDSSEYIIVNDFDALAIAKHK